MKWIYAGEGERLWLGGNLGKLEWIRSVDVMCERIGVEGGYDCLVGGVFWDDYGKIFF